MDKVLLVCSSQKSIPVISQALDNACTGEISSAGSGGQARRMLINTVFDLIVINMPLSDETGVSLGAAASESGDAGIILLTPADDADFVQDQVEDYGIFVLPKPLSQQSLHQAIKFVTASRMRILHLREKQVQLQQKLEDLKVVDRAKCCLIQYLNMSEPQAHRYIEKQSMDMRASRRTVAEDIIKTYER